MKNNTKIINMRIAGEILNNIFVELRTFVKPGISTKEVELETIKLLDTHKVKSGTLGLSGFPSFICISINEEILQGIPNNRVINEGDLVKLDLTIQYKGVYVDKAITIGIEPLHFSKRYILTAVDKCLDDAITACFPGISNLVIGDIIYKTAAYLRVKVIREYGGHGIGLDAHQFPFIPNYGTFNKECKLYEGMTFTIEPILTYFNSGVFKKGLAVIGDPVSAHAEETILITDSGYEVFTR